MSVGCPPRARGVRIAEARATPGLPGLSPRNSPDAHPVIDARAAATGVPGPESQRHPPTHPPRPRAGRIEPRPRRRAPGGGHANAKQLLSNCSAIADPIPRVLRGLLQLGCTHLCVRGRGQRRLFRGRLEHTWNAAPAHAKTPVIGTRQREEWRKTLVFRPWFEIARANGAARGHTVLRPG